MRDSVKLARPELTVRLTHVQGLPSDVGTWDGYDREAGLAPCAVAVIEDGARASRATVWWDACIPPKPQQVDDGVGGTGA